MTGMSDLAKGSSPRAEAGAFGEVKTQLEWK